MSKRKRGWLGARAAGLRDRWLHPLQVSLRASEAAAAARDTASKARDARLRTELEHVRFALASLQARQARTANTLQEAEFKGYSQFGEDGAIQWLVARVPLANHNFVEFGVGSYEESNTRFLLEHDNWSGLIIDRDDAPLQFVKQAGLAWRRSINVVSAFITVEGINDLLAGLPEDTGLLSVDLDGVDYWVLDAITVIRPRIVVCEYNSLFGPTAPVSVPYSAGFDRVQAHYSTLYFGASISALGHWATERGYRLVGSSAEGVNAFMVRDDVAGDLPGLSGAEAWQETRVRQARSESGELMYLDGLQAQRDLIAGLPLVDVVTGTHMTVADL
jgi:hypothetical protein